MSARATRWPGTSGAALAGVRRGAAAPFWRALDAVLGVPKPYDAAAIPAEVGPTRTHLGRWFDAHLRLLRAVAVVAVSFQAGYLSWRVGLSWAHPGVNPVLSLGLFVCELYGVISLVSLAVFSWRPPRSPHDRPAVGGSGHGPSVDVFVCTYDEPACVLRPTLLGARALTYPHTTYLLDDGRRPQMRALAEELGAVWLTRPDNTHAKAGNINHALTVTTGDLVLILDADHVPLPDALEDLVGYFRDPALALVQSPHDFFNHDSCQHYAVGRHEQSVFFEVICPGKDHHGGAFWCGSATLVRREALLQVGGVATETIAEDFHTTIKMHQLGWATRYHDRVLVQGIAPHDLDGYLLQRDRWARGNLSVLHTPQSPLRAKTIGRARRLSYAASLLGYGAGPARALLLLCLATTLWTGQLPMRASWPVLLLVWAPATVLSLFAGNVLCRGHMTSKESVHFELLTCEIYTRALSCLLRPSRTGFKVTPKSGTDEGGWPALRRLRLVMALSVLLAAGVLARALEAVGVWGVSALPDIPTCAAWVIPGLALLELRRLLRTLRLVARRRQRRREFRFGCHEPAHLLLDDAGHAPTPPTPHRPPPPHPVLARAVPLPRGATLPAPNTAAARPDPATPATPATSDDDPPGDPRRVPATLVDAAPGGLGLTLAQPLAVGSAVAVQVILATLRGHHRELVIPCVVRACRRLSPTTPSTRPSAQPTATPCTAASTPAPDPPEPLRPRYKIGLEVIGGEDAAPDELVAFCYILCPARRLRGPAWAAPARTPATEHTRRVPPPRSPSRTSTTA